MNTLPARPSLHRGNPARDVGPFGVIESRDFAERDHADPEIGGDRQLLAAHIRVGPDDVLIQNTEPAAGLLATPGQVRSLDRRVRTLVVWKNLRIDDAVAEL